MSFFDDAQQFMARRKQDSSDDPDERREALIARLQHDFENATRREIERALNRLSEQGSVFDDYPTVVKKVRIWLED